jgi:ADP-ribose pyrophosphatase
MEKWINKNIIFKGKTISLVSGMAKSDTNGIFQRDIVEHPGGVGIVPILDDSILFVRQYRIAVSKEIVEIPAGMRENGESPEEAAGRELEEETGYQAGRLKLMAGFFVSVGYTSEKIHVFLAENLKKTIQKPDSDENLVIVKVKISDIPELLRKRWFEDSKTIIGLQYYLSKYHKNPSVR